VGGLAVHRMVARDGFSALWLTEPLEAGFAETCMRVIPLSGLLSPRAEERFASELAFWRGQSGGSVVGLYDHGRDGPFLYMLMQYMPEGSAADQLGRGSGLRERLVELAIDLAAALSDVHQAVGPHGNLKPSNIFPVRGRGALLSDFLLPLWLDEFAAGNAALAARIEHPYRSPEQRENPTDYDTRSDVYSFGLVLTWCLSGAEPDGSGGLPDGLEWPGGLGEVVRRCIEADRDRRYADGAELLEALLEATGRQPRPVRAEEPAPEEAEEEPARAVVRQLTPEETLAEARTLADQGLLEEAVERLESLPRSTEGMAELLDEIERRRDACRELTAEAVRLAGMGRADAALDNLRQAEDLWANSATVAALKADLAREAGRDERELSAPAADPLQEALERGDYERARELLEKACREGRADQGVVEALRRFKRERVGAALMENVRQARRLYVQGHREAAERHWLEAARWLPPGSARERLRRFARAARSGKLRVKVPEMPLFEREGAGGHGPPAAASFGGELLERWRHSAGWRPLLVAIAAACAGLALVLLLVRLASG